MIADLLMCWYALGLVACGVNFATCHPANREPVLFCALCPAFIFLRLFIAILIVMWQRIDTSKQYLWRRPEPVRRSGWATLQSFVDFTRPVSNERGQKGSAYE